MLRLSVSVFYPVCAGAVLALTLASPCLGQSASRAAPLPPARPSLTPAAPAQPAPASRPTRPAVPNDDADLDPDRPPVLPSASRAKMHSCGREWQDMKRRGADRDITWRQFATACLQRS